MRKITEEITKIQIQSFLCDYVMQARLLVTETQAEKINCRSFNDINEHTIHMQNLMCHLCPSTSEPFKILLSANSEVSLSKYPHLFRCLLNFILHCMHEADHILPFNSITISKNIITKLQSTGDGLCFQRAFGQFTGGELQINTEFYITHNRSIFFQTSDLYAHRWFRGTKYSLITSQVDVSDQDKVMLQRWGCPTTHAPLALPYQLRISIISRDLGSFNTYVTSTDVRLELPYKRQGVWALRLNDDLTITDKELIDTYFHCDSFEIKDWEHTIYTVSDTACAASRPLPVSFYEKIFRAGLRLPRIDYRTPFLFFVSQKWGNVAMIGNRRLPFMASLYFNGCYMKACSSSSLHSDLQELQFE